MTATLTGAPSIVITVESIGNDLVTKIAATLLIATVIVTL